MKYLKITSPGFETYTGNLGGIDFFQGRSVDFVPRLFADRLTAAMQMVEVDADGNEEPAGVSHRLVADAAERAPMIEPLERQTDEERAAEDQDQLNRAIRSDVVILTREELEEIMSKSGIKGLREAAAPWGVKDRNAVALIEQILEAQSAFIADRDAKLGVLVTLMSPPEGATEAPAEEAPAEEAPAEEAPAEETPADEAPAEETPAEGADIKKSSDGDDAGNAE